jgi:lysozyme family protein
MDTNFIAAVNHCLLYEVGPWFDPTDPDTIAGNIDTVQQRRKCGYVNIDGDSGGCTKYGISQRANPSVNVQELTLAQAQQIYHDSYWLASKCDRITIPVTIFYFDMVVNNGGGRAAKILQGCVGATQDGNVGPQTLAAVNSQDPTTLINAMHDARNARYNQIAQNDPSQEQFLAGWLRRSDEVRQFNLSQLS